MENANISGRLCIVNYTDCDGAVQAMPLQVFEQAYGDIESAIRAASREFCQTRAGLAEYENNGRNFDMADFWQSVPDDVCIKHGFRKIKNFDALDPPESNQGGPLFQLSDLDITPEIRDDVANELDAGPTEELLDMLEACGCTDGIPVHDQEKHMAFIRSYISCEYAPEAKADVLEYWLDHCASCVDPCAGTAGSEAAAKPVTAKPGKTIQIVAAGKYGRESVMHVLNLDGSRSIMDAVEAAAKEYALTPEGMRYWRDHDMNFCISDFWDACPDSICASHGFLKQPSMPVVRVGEAIPLFRDYDLDIAAQDWIMTELQLTLVHGPVGEFKDLLYECGVPDHNAAVDGKRGMKALRDALSQEPGEALDDARKTVIRYFMSHCMKD